MLSLLYGDILDMRLWNHFGYVLGDVLNSIIIGICFLYRNLFNPSSFFVLNHFSLVRLISDFFNVLILNYLSFIRIILNVTLSYVSD